MLLSFLLRAKRVRSTILSVLVASAASFGLHHLAQAQEATSSHSNAETITIDTAGSFRPFPHFWEQMFGSGRANLTLRESYRHDLQAVKQITDFKYVRFHAIFHDENGVYDEDKDGKPIYNWTYVDQIYDGVLANGVKPFVELSFMPRKLAANLAPHPFWYKPLPSPPKDPAKWAALITAFVQHLEERYGKEEVQSWYFEVWNEPNIDFWNGRPAQETYFALYDTTARAVRGVDDKLKIGGPATAQAAWADAFIAHCVQNHVPFDYVSTHVYGNDTSKDIFGKDMPIKRRDMVALAAKKVYDQVKASPAPNTPIIWSEYNATYMSEVPVTDSAFMGPWLANHIRASDGLVTMMSYWTFSDVFEEQGIVKTPFYGGFGLMAERSIPKAAFRVFELLHRLGTQRLLVPSENALVTKRDDGTIVVALWNYAEPGEKVEPKQFTLNISGAKLKHFRMQFVAPGHGSSLEAFQAMGSPSNPSLSQIRQLVAASEMQKPVDGETAKTFVLGSQELAVLELRK